MHSVSRGRLESLPDFRTKLDERRKACTTLTVWRILRNGMHAIAHGKRLTKMSVQLYS